VKIWLFFASDHTKGKQIAIILTPGQSKNSVGLNTFLGQVNQNIILLLLGF
jgi:hypothetical protein